jgi:protein-S-isoprenylcysteine O-methyltransferase Ste14
MSLASRSQAQRQQQDPDVLARVGGWLFRRRSWIPAPIALILLLVPSPSPVSPGLLWSGRALVLTGEFLRLWAVRHIGVISRTRADRLGPLVATGPFARVRNPLYIGNMALWVGFAATAGLGWLVPPILLLLAVGYHAIVRWEERLLETRLGEAYRTYAARVPRWVPRLARGQTGTGSSATVFPWAHTLYSERGTLIAVAIGYLLLWFKSHA